jgi:hypothetical protein
MKTLMFVLFAFSGTISLFAQDNYLFPQFTQAHIYYKSEKDTKSVPANYNLFTSSVVIREGEKLKSLSNVENLEYVLIGKTKFVYLRENAFGEIVVDGTLILALQHSADVVKTDECVEKATKSSLNKTLNAGGVLPDGVKIEKKAKYYFLKQRNPDTKFYLPGVNVEKATRQGILKLFGKRKSEIEAFIEENDIDFTLPEDLEKLTNFCEKFT